MGFWTVSVSCLGCSVAWLTAAGEGTGNDQFFTAATHPLVFLNYVRQLLEHVLVGFEIEY